MAYSFPQSLKVLVNQVVKNSSEIFGLFYGCRDYLTRKLFGPREILNRHILGLSYYYQGAWHLALIKHVNKKSRVMSVKGSYDLVSGNSMAMDVTDAVKLILGPAEDCYGQDIYPEDMGFSSLTFEVLTDDYTSARMIVVKSKESIIKKLQEPQIIENFVESKSSNEKL